jgi:hypothetical protein
VQRQPGHGFLGDVCAVVIQHDANQRTGWVVLVQALEQADEFDTAVVPHQIVYCT